MFFQEGALWSLAVGLKFYNAGDLGSIPESGRSPGEGNGSPLQYFCLGNPVDRGAWRATVRGIKKNWTQLSKAAKHTHLKKKKNGGGWIYSQGALPW